MLPAASSDKPVDRASIRNAQRQTLVAEPAPSDSWETLPAYPLAPGVAGVAAGTNQEVLLAAGGANFPDRLPWEGGMKKTYDEIFALPADGTSWQLAGRLPEPRAYAAVVSTPAGVLVLGGENASGVRADSRWLRWVGGRAEVLAGPALPGPLSSPVATVLDDWVYLAGGYQPGPPRTGTAGFYRLKLSDPAAEWETLPTWPGPARGQGVIAAAGGAIYLFSGLELAVGADGKAVTNYLADAYRYLPSQGWEQLPDMPWSAVAAPSPAPVAGDPVRVYVLGGVDGREIGKLPRETRVPEDILYFDVVRHEWRLVSYSWPEPVVTAPAVECSGRWIFVSGEPKAGRRTTVVSAWQPS